MIIEAAIASKAGLAPVPALAAGVIATAGLYLGWKQYRTWQARKANAAWSARMMSGQTYGSGFQMPPGS